MNPRQRLFAALNREPVDHVPVWLLFPFHRIDYYGDVRNEPCYKEVFKASQKYAITLNQRNPSVHLFTPEVKEWSEVTSTAEERIERKYFEYQGRQLCAETCQ